VRCCVYHLNQRRLPLLSSLFQGDVAWTLGFAALSCVAVSSPVIAFQWLGYLYYCCSPGSPAPEWCGARVPLMYSYLQAEFWGVGFLRYFTLSQVWKPRPHSASNCLPPCSCSYARLFVYLLSAVFGAVFLIERNAFRFAS
jgi:hypothetical protein